MRTPVFRTLAVVLAGIGLAALCAAAIVTPSTTSGYLAKVTNSTNTAATAQYFKCTAAAVADKSSAVFQYYLNDPSNSSTATDSSGNGLTGIYVGTMTTSVTKPIACPRDVQGAYVLDGTTSYLSYPLSSPNPTTFTEEVWFKTTVAAGKLIGFGSSQTGSSSMYDRHIYMSTTGQLIFGIYNSAVGATVITSPKTYNDGFWHQVTATLSPTTGMQLFVDGALVSNASYLAPQNYSGYWRIGYDNTNYWFNNGTNFFFNGQMRYAAVYSTVLTPTQILNHYTAGQ